MYGMRYVLIDPALADGAELFERELKDAAIGRRQKFSTSRSSGCFIGRKTARIVTVGAISHHICLRLELVVVAGLRSP